jgi:hypothetical protein
MKKKGMVMERMGTWILLIIILIILLTFVYFKKEHLLDAIESMKTAFRFGG